MSTELTVPMLKIDDAIVEYHNQYELLRQQLEQLERNFNEQKTNGINTLHMLTGAIKSLEQLRTIAVPAVPPAAEADCKECEERREDSREDS